ncbi:MAG TPA: alpha/beta hydrolase [Solirubrobacteraceae bacterium]|nr:alpha/beta hydrolase [Solirubrobacteraceae bacterium]
MTTLLDRGRRVELASGRRINVLETGDGVPALFLHGSSTDSRSLLPLLPHLDGVRAIVVDRPGFGRSDPVRVPKERFRAAAVAFVDEILDAFGLERPALAGNSMGGTWALWYALARPERVRRLVLVGSAPLLPGTRAPAPLRLMATPVVGALLARVKPNAAMVVRLMASMGEKHSIVRHPELLATLVATGRDPAATAVNRAELRAVLGPLGFRRSALVRAEDLRRVRAPTLLIWGDRDPVATVEAARVTAELIPQAELAVLPAGHVPYLGHPERTAALLSSFVRR